MVLNAHTLYTQTTDHHSTMMNLTSRLAVRIQHIPEDIDWNDSTPQCSVDSLTINHFMVSETVGTEYTARYMVMEFTALEHLKRHLPEQQQTHPVIKTEYVPMKVLFKDEKYISETVDILSTLMKDADLKGNNQVSKSCSDYFIRDFPQCQIQTGAYTNAYMHSFLC